VTKRKITKQTNNSHLNIYLTPLDNKGATYQFASRYQTIDELAMNNEELSCNAVRILPFYIKEGKKYFILIKEYRLVVNKTLHSLPAGLVNPNEDYDQSAIRELEEETGYIAKTIISKTPPLFTSPGLSDESIINYVIEVDPIPKSQHLDEFEEIEVLVVESTELIKLLDSPTIFGYQSKYFIESYLYQSLYLDLKSSLNS
jgi:ADP-ribose pyrophosphatase